MLVSDRGTGLPAKTRKPSLQCVVVGHSREPEGRPSSGILYGALCVTRIGLSQSHKPSILSSCVHRPQIVPKSLNGPPDLRNAPWVQGKGLRGSPMAGGRAGETSSLVCSTDHASTSNQRHPSRRRVYCASDSSRRKPLTFEKHPQLGPAFPAPPHVSEDRPPTKPSLLSDTPLLQVEPQAPQAALRLDCMVLLLVWGASQEIAKPIRKGHPL